MKANKALNSNLFCIMSCDKQKESLGVKAKESLEIASAVFQTSTNALSKHFAVNVKTPRLKVKHSKRFSPSVFNDDIKSAFPYRTSDSFLPTFDYSNFPLSRDKRNIKILQA